LTPVLAAYGLQKGIAANDDKVRCCHILGRSGILRAPGRRPVPSVRPTKETHTDASAAGAGIFLLAALVLLVGIGLGAGWLLGVPVVGAVIGAVVGVPLSLYLVYRRYRDI
jgi:hypothetical protein